MTGDGKSHCILTTHCYITEVNVLAARQLNTAGQLLLIGLVTVGLLWVFVGGSDSFRRTTRALIVWTVVIVGGTALLTYMDSCEGLFETVCQELLLWRAAVAWFIGFVALSLVWLMSRPPSHPVDTDPAERLARLTELRRTGLLSEEEFSERRRRLLDRL